MKIVLLSAVSIKQNKIQYKAKDDLAGTGFTTYDKHNAAKITGHF